MIAVSIKKDDQGLINGFRCSGHAGYCKKGSDIVCAAVSALVFTSVLALEKLLELPLTVNQDDDGGIVDCCWVNVSEGYDNKRVYETDLIIKVMLLGLTEIQQQYPEFLRIEVEV